MPENPQSFPYAELEVASCFSFLRGACQPGELVQRAAELGYAAIGITDFNTVCGIVRAHEAAVKAGIQLCVGARLIFEDAPDILVWPEDRAAYGRLCRLLTIGKRRAEKGICTLQLTDFLAHVEGMQAAVVYSSPDLAPTSAGW
jgi:error-prone DNA polymerase